ncbi:DRTGG domain-containing protein [Desulfofundulus thermobenzoicus]|uniref:DRTGG domain-containing protein n=1 Tax=Desulfofundulus thermobenzoicus TaxID=29376 RepID=UPI00311A9F45
MTADSALTYLRRSADKAVILGGDRADMALAALETSTAVLILTGGLYPDVKVIARAQEKNVPLILVHYDTYTTVEKINHLTRRLKPGNTTAIQVALENVEKYCQWQTIVEAMR